MSIPVFIPVSNPEEDGGGTSGPTIYTGDGSLAGVRTVDLNGNSVYFKRNGDDSGTLISENGGSEGNLLSVILNGQIIARFNDQAESNLGIDAVYPSGLFMIAPNVPNHPIYIGDWDGAVNGTLITIKDGTRTITYKAATHTFNGVIDLPVQSAPTSPNDGDIWREDNTNTGLKIRINGVTKTITVS